MTKKQIIPKLNEIYYVTNDNLGINDNQTLGHRVVIVGINKRKNKVKVKTITSLEYYHVKNKRYYFKDSKLNLVRDGEILPIPKRDLNSNHYSGIDHRTIIVKVKDLEQQRYGDFTFPRRYKHLIDKKR